MGERVTRELDGSVGGIGGSQGNKWRAKRSFSGVKRSTSQSIQLFDSGH